MIHAVYFCDHNFAVHCDIKVDIIIFHNFKFCIITFEFGSLDELYFWLLLYVTKA